MAYLREGWSNQQLAERFHKEAPQLSPVEIAARFGTPRHPGRDDLAPYSFLEADPYSEQGIRNYREIKRIDYEDEHKREYERVGPEAPDQLYVRLPIAITRRENREDTPTLMRQNFPRPGELITLTSRQNQRKRKGATPVPDQRVTVSQVIYQRRATALIAVNEVLQLSDDDGEDDLEAEDERNSRLEKRIATETRKLQKKAVQLGETPDTLVSYTREQRVPPNTSGGGGGSRTRGFAAPKAPRAPKFH